MADVIATVTSELYAEIQGTAESRTDENLRRLRLPVVLRHTIQKTRSSDSTKNSTSTDLEEDTEGDLNVGSRLSYILLEYKSSTPLATVGEQVWRGALMMADFILSSPLIFHQSTNVLELGSGTGLTGIVAGAIVKRVICTDVDRGDILNICEHNVTLNDHIIREECEVCVRPLDWTDEELPRWMTSDPPKIDVIIASDVIYDNELTDAFVKILDKLLLYLKPANGAFLGMEKRFVFTLSDLDSVAPMYEHFVGRMRDTTRWNVQLLKLDDLTQRIHYKRTDELVLWHITRACSS